MNAENINRDLSKFLMSCNFCIQQAENCNGIINTEELNNLNSNKTAETLQTNQHTTNNIKTACIVEIFCFNCMTAYCDECFKKIHQIDASISQHNPVPIQSIV
jgi:hypothetical protein